MTLQVAAAVTGRPLPAPWGPDGAEVPRALKGAQAIVPKSAGSLVGPLLAAIRRDDRWDDLAAWRDEALLVAAAFHDSPDPLFARDVRGVGWNGGVDRSRSVATLAVQRRWAERLQAAAAWDAAGRPTNPTPTSPPRTGKGATVSAALDLLGDTPTAPNVVSLRRHRV